VRRRGLNASKRSRLSKANKIFIIVPFLTHSPLSSWTDKKPPILKWSHPQSEDLLLSKCRKKASDVDVIEISDDDVIEISDDDVIEISDDDVVEIHDDVVVEISDDDDDVIKISNDDVIEISDDE
jgi:hypothetical protein